MSENKTITCKNCGAETSENYCSNCGQSTQVKRLDNRHLYHDIPLSVFNFEKGILFTIKSIIFHPIATIKEYLEGKRTKYYKPLSLLMLLTTIVFFINSYFNPTKKILKSAGIEIKKRDIEATHFMQNHPNLFMLFIIPFMAYGFYLAFKKYKNNFAEHFYIVVFIQIFYLLIASIPNLIILNNVNIEGFAIYQMISFLFYPAFYFAFYYKQEPNKLKLLLKSIWGMLLNFIVIIALFITVSLIVILAIILFKFAIKMMHL